MGPLPSQHQPVGDRELFADVLKHSVVDEITKRRSWQSGNHDPAAANLSNEQGDQRQAVISAAGLLSKPSGKCPVLLDAEYGEAVLTHHFNCMLSPSLIPFGITGQVCRVSVSL